MKIVRLLSLACVLSLLAACGSRSLTAPEAAPPQVEARYQSEGNGTFGSGS